MKKKNEPSNAGKAHSARMVSYATFCVVFGELCGREAAAEQPRRFVACYKEFKNSRMSA